MPIDATSIADQLMLGRYRVLDERGKGGFGTVCVCWDPRLMRRVAIKTIPLHMAEPVVKPSRKKGARAFEGQPALGAAPEQAPFDQVEHNMLLRAALAETRTASMLAHPNIVSMLDFESDDENAYIIMEYVEGASLSELLDATEDGLLTMDEAAAVAESVVDALQFAHENGVLHLDIKPDNILIEASGRVKLADFGMAALSSVTGFAGARGGTVGYMPPEQITCAKVDIRTDVFAFASVMYEALTGVRPFAAGTLGESLELVRRGAADPCALNEDIPPQVADALLAALDPEPNLRPDSAEAFGDELLAGLGRPKAGRKSLAAFVADVLDDSRPDEDDEDQCTDEDAPGRSPFGMWLDLGPLSCSFPRLAPWALRALAAASSGMAAGLAVQSVAASVPPYPALVAGFAVAGLALAAPPLGGALAVTALVAACLVAHLWWFAAALIIGGAAWWALVARRIPRGSAGTLSGCLSFSGHLPIPPLLCGYLLPAGPAALAAFVGFAAAGALTCLGGAHSLDAFQVAGFATSHAGQATLCAASLARSPDFWLTGASWVAAAAALGGICNGGSKSRCYVGCLVAGAILVAFELVICRMENGGSWTALSPEALAAALGSTILLGMCVCMFGSPRALDVDGAGPQPEGD